MLTRTMVYVLNSSLYLVRLETLTFQESTYNLSHDLNLNFYLFIFFLTFKGTVRFPVTWKGTGRLRKTAGN